MAIMCLLLIKIESTAESRSITDMTASIEEKSFTYNPAEEPEYKQACSEDAKYS